MKQKKDVLLPVLVIAVIVVIGIVVVSAVLALWYQVHWRGFVSSLSSSTVAAYQEESLTCRTPEGEEVSIDGDNIYRIYNALTLHTPRLRLQCPKSVPDYLLRYGDGAVLRLWNVEQEKDGRKEHGTLFQYTDREGKTWLYDTWVWQMNGSYLEKS